MSTSDYSASLLVVCGINYSVHSYEDVWIGVLIEHMDMTLTDP